MDLLPHDDPMAHTLSGFEGVQPFNPIDPFASERGELIKRGDNAWREIWDAEDPGRRQTAMKQLDEVKVGLQKLDENERRLFHPADAFRAAHNQYDRADELIGVPLLRLGLLLGLPLTHGRAHREDLRDPLGLIASDLTSWLIAQVRVLEAIGICIRLMLDPDGKTGLFGKNERRGFTEGYDDRPRIDGLNLLRTRDLELVRGICPPLADLLSSADWMHGLYEKRNQVAHGFAMFSPLQSWASGQWVTNSFGWPGQIIDTEAYVSRTVFSVRELSRRLAHVMDHHLKSAFSNYAPADFKQYRGDGPILEALKVWEETGRLRVNSIALRIGEPRLDEARDGFEKLASHDPDPRTSCKLGHKLSAKIDRDARGRTVLRASCDCGPRQVSEELEQEFSRRFMEHGPHYERPTVPIWRPSVRG